jgi:hypothetical protein
MTFVTIKKSHGWFDIIDWLEANIGVMDTLDPIPSGDGWMIQHETSFSMSVGFNDPQNAILFTLIFA